MAGCGTRPDGPDDTDQDLTAEIVESLRAIAATYGRRPKDVGAERSRRWSQIADDVAAGRLAELDAIEAAANAGHAIDVTRPADTTNGAAQ